jgi:hypothetical protein
MWPSITVRVVQDTDFWQIFAQMLSSTAIIIAAVVAAWFANNKERNKNKTKGKYLLSLLRSLESYIVVFSDSIRVDDWDKAQGYFHVISKESSNIIDLLETKIFSFASCMTEDTLDEIQHLIFYFKEDKKTFDSYSPKKWEESDREKHADSWKITIESVHSALELHRRYCRPIIIRNISLMLYRCHTKRLIRKQYSKNKTK